MITFKTFLLEASSGKAKWEKYFGADDVQTIAKNDADLWDLFGEPVKKKILKGEKLTVLAGEYDTKPQVRIGRGTYTMKFTDIEKPFKVERTVGINLKPDQLGITGPVHIEKYAAKVKGLIDDHSEIPEATGEYLKALVDSAESPDDTDLQDVLRDLYVSAGVKDDQPLKNTINNDFMEVLGPFFVVDEKPAYKAGGAKFPDAGNEPLYDFTMKFKNQVDWFSSKRAGGNTNTLKVTQVLKGADEGDVKLRKKYSRELELLRIIQDSPVKAAPDKINEWLAKTFPGKYKKAPATTDNTTIARLEAAVAKFINEHTDLDFKPLVQQAVPDLMYVRARLNADGTLKVEPLKAGRDLEKATLRSKSSPGHLTDKLGFAL